MAKQFVFDDEAQKALLLGVDAVANVVKATLGPKGKNVVLDKKFATPLITNDGVTIAREIELHNTQQNIGAKLIKEVCIKTNDVAGDGTTTAIVLAQCMLKEGLEKTKNYSPLSINEGLKLACDECVKILQKNSKKVSSYKEIEQVATISSNDASIGKMIATAKQRVGKNGVITLCDGNSEKTQLVCQEGLQFDKGYASPYFCNDLEKMQVVFDDCLLLIADKKIESIHELLPLLEQIVNTPQKLVVLCNDIEDEVLSTLVVNKVRGSFNCAVIKAPFFAEKRTDFLQDVAILCGTRAFSPDKGDKLSNIMLEDLGKLKQAKITRESCTFVSKNGNKSLLEERIGQIKKQIEISHGFEKEQLKIRLSKLCGGVAVINVGATTEIELKEKKLRIEDAINATNSALLKGIIAGGGVGILRCFDMLNALYETLQDDKKVGVEIMKNVVLAPIRQILINSECNAQNMIEIILKNQNSNFGFDAHNNIFCDMMLNGIVDPTFVTISALKNATSIVTTMLTTSALVFEDEIFENNAK